MNHKCAGKFATMGIDGWSMVTSDPVVGLSITVEGRCYLVNTLDTTGQSYTAEYLSGLAQYYNVETNFDGKMIRCVSKNASNMENAIRDSRQWTKMSCVKRIG